MDGTKTVMMDNPRATSATRTGVGMRMEVVLGLFVERTER